MKSGRYHNNILSRITYYVLQIEVIHSKIV